jgi:uroporphyrinogen decarboxylase
MASQPLTVAQPALQGAPSSLFLRACLGLPAERTPIWLMRQAGRYMPEYRALRTRYGMLELIRTPELAAEVTLQPVDAFGVDAAIIFSDILPPLVGMGLDLDFVGGVGPHIANPIGRSYDVDVLGTPPAEETMRGTLDAISIVARELGPRDIPVIGFAGAPFTLASYAIEGGATKDFGRTKAFMLSQPAAWHRLMTKLVTVQADYLAAQVRAGASALQVFDSWAGRALGRSDYVRYVQPHNTRLFDAVRRTGVPIVNFSLGVTPYLEEAIACGGDVIGIDWHLPLGPSWERIGHHRPVQGNLDPTALLAPWRELKVRVDEVLDGAGGRPGHIFNVGHGILKDTPVDSVRRLVEYVAETTSGPRVVA